MVMELAMHIWLAYHVMFVSESSRTVHPGFNVEVREKEALPLAWEKCRTLM